MGGLAEVPASMANQGCDLSSGGSQGYNCHLSPLHPKGCWAPGKKPTRSNKAEPGCTPGRESGLRGLACVCGEVRGSPWACLTPRMGPESARPCSLPPLAPPREKPP